MVVPLIIMGAIAAATSIPSLFPNAEAEKIKRSQEVINQTGDGYYTRNTWRTTRRQVYPNVNGTPKKMRDKQQIVFYGAIAAVVIIGFMVIRK